MMASGARRGLLVDYGGVLTSTLGSWFGAADDAAGLPRGSLVGVIVDAYSQPEGDSFIHRLERGEITREQFEAEFGQELVRRGHDVQGDGLFCHFEPGFAPQLDNGMWDVVRRARERGVATGLLSNSWGVDDYPIEHLRVCFEDLVISGEVGLRKPDPAIFRLACERLGVRPQEAILVDDFEVNLAAAEQVGITGVLHTGDVAATTAALQSFLGVPLSA